MRILFTGASSFSGYWFVKELSAAGHQVTAVFRSNLDAYEGTRKKRIDDLLNVCNPIFACSFGSDHFLDVIKNDGPWDLFCHHAADVTNYKSQDFDVAQAVNNNTFNLNAVLDAFQDSKCKKIALTGSVFEANEGAGADLWKAFSPYGLSKGFTADIFRYHTSLRDLKLGKFVIPNPFGPYEDPRFTTYLVKNWVEGKTPSVNTPLYIRDNIHVSLLAKAYRHFIEHLSDQCPRYERCHPSGYVESQGDFTQRFSKAMETHLKISCPFNLGRQTQFPEPKMRVNTDPVVALPIQWDEEAAWKELADYYRLAFDIEVGVCS